MIILSAILATWRLTSLLCYEDGPATMFERLRSCKPLTSLLSCFWCTSVWAAIPFAYLITDSWQTWPVSWLGLSAGAIIVEEMVKRIMAGEAR